MANLLEDFITYLTNQGVVTGDGVDAFRDIQPDKPDDVVTVREYAGSPTTTGVEAVERSLQILARSKTPSVARSKIHQIFNLIDTPLNRIKYLTETRWIVAYARQTPFKYNVDANGRTVFAFNLGVATTRD